MSFKVGEKVVYPNHGVGIIEQITHNNINGNAEQFYLVRIMANGLRVTVPCGNAEAVGLRRVIKPAEVPKVIGRLQNGQIDSYRDWKFRFKQNSEKMRNGSLYDVAEVLKSLLAVSQAKSLSFREKKMLERARHLLVSELATARNVKEMTVEESLQKALGKSKLRLPEATYLPPGGSR